MDKQTEYRERGAERCSDSEPERQTHREKNRQDTNRLKKAGEGKEAIQTDRQRQTDRQLSLAKTRKLRGLVRVVRVPTAVMKR